MMRPGNKVLDLQKSLWLDFTGCWESGSVHTGQQGSVLGLPPWIIRWMIDNADEATE